MLLNRRWTLLLTTLVFLSITFYISHSPPAAVKGIAANLPPAVKDYASKIPSISLPELDIPGFRNPDKNLFKLQYEPRDSHPISSLISTADQQFRAYEVSSSTFQEAVAKYRSTYGRHPPPGFAEWYKFAKKRDVHNVDDFEQIMEDLRPFWSVHPTMLRSMASNLWEQDKSLGAVHIRNGKVAKDSRPSERTRTFAKMVDSFVTKLPDMDITINAMNQPRVVVPWDDLQKALKEEKESRVQLPETVNEFTKDMSGFTKTSTNGTNHHLLVNAQWYDASAKHFMDFAKKACPSNSHANNGEAREQAEAKFKSASGFLHNVKESMDLCRMGTEVSNLHGFLFSSSNMSITHILVPVFGEAKTSVNNDILFPGTNYWEQDRPIGGVSNKEPKFEEKKNKFYWRGITDSGVQTAGNWALMQRARLVSMLNATFHEGGEIRIVGQSSLTTQVYDKAVLDPENFLAGHSDVAFVESWNCKPDCSFYDTAVTMVPQPLPTERLLNRYLFDVDGETYTGQLRPLLQSRSLPIRASVFREWHDSRLFAWRHFVPIDIRYDDLLSILAYFIGVGEPKVAPTLGSPLVPNHKFEAKRIALQGREWAGKVLRKEDMEIYLYRLLLEYGRLIDDNRDKIGYSGTGSEVDDELGTH